MSVTIFVDSILEARRTGVAVDPGPNLRTMPRPTRRSG